jgi:hypothetical protein
MNCGLLRRTTQRATTFKKPYGFRKIFNHEESNRKAGREVSRILLKESVKLRGDSRSALSVIENASAAMEDEFPLWRVHITWPSGFGTPVQSLLQAHLRGVVCLLLEARGELGESLLSLERWAIQRRQCRQRQRNRKAVWPAGVNECRMKTSLPPATLPRCRT